MFNYENLSTEQIIKLENSEAEYLAKAGLMIIHGVRKGILTDEDGLKQLHNILIAVVVNS